MDQRQLSELISKKAANWHDEFGDHTVRWEMSDYKNSLMPFRVLGCKMHSSDFVAEGYGTSWSREEAFHKAFCEAWERLWLRLLQSRTPEAQKITSNGFAAGLDLESTAQFSLQEKIERSVLLEAWTKRKGWRQTKCYSTKSLPIIVALRLKSWKVNFFSIQSNLGVVRACLLRHSEHGAVFDSAFLRQEPATDAKLILSVTKDILAPSSAPSMLEEIAEPLDHKKFYRSPKNLEAFTFLDESPVKSSIIALENSKALRTEVITNVSGLPVVCRTTHPTWMDITWGKQSIQGSNPWPHPLA